MQSELLDGCKTMHMAYGIPRRLSAQLKKNDNVIELTTRSDLISVTVQESSVSCGDKWSVWG